MKKYLLMTVLIALNGILMAQNDPCGYEDYRNYLIEQDSTNRILYHAKKQWVEKFRLQKLLDTGISEPFSEPYGAMGMPSGGTCNPTKYIIPVVVNIVHLPSDGAPGTGTNISDAQVMHQIEVLNQHFASNNTDIQFCLAKAKTNGDSSSGIVRYPDLLSEHHMPSETDDLFSLSNGNGFDITNYLNIYVVQTILNNQGQDAGVLGYATLPGAALQGIVMRHNWFGNATTCGSCTLDSQSRGDALTHEAGHFLGLEHTFFGACTTPDSCSTSGDLCCDTPPCQQSTGCSSSNTCSETYNGDSADDIHNYMGYNAPDCKNRFTPNQIEIMHAVLENARAELIQPQNVNARKLECCFFSAFFGADKTFLCQQLVANDTVSFEAYEYEGASYYWEIRDSSGTLITTYSDTLPVFSYTFDTTVQFYSVKLEITRGTNTTQLSRNRFIQVADCGNPIASTQGNWLFGKYAGIQFTDKGVMRDIIPSRFNPLAINTGEGTISMSDSSGTMLFHGGGINSETEVFNLFDKEYRLMSHSPIIGNGSSLQGGIVIPVPGSQSRYYLFTVYARFSDAEPITPYQGLHYSIIDMSLNSGNGDVDTNYKNISIKAVNGVYPNPFDSTFMSGENITSIPKCNSQDQWLLVVGADSAAVASTVGLAYIHLFSVDSQDVVYHGRSDSLAGGMYSELIVSPNGKFVFCGGALYDFDRINGDLKLINRFESGEQYGSASFSSDSKLLYVLHSNPTTYPTNTIYQYDLSYSTPELSAKAIGTVLGNTNTALQLGPDDKIYVAQVAQNRLAVIESPDIRVSANGSNECGFSTDGPLLSSGGIGGISQQGLPNFSDVSEDINHLDFVYTDSACGNFTFRPISCSLDNKWYFGDGDSANTNTAKHQYSSTGDYYVTLISGGDTLTKQISIGVETPSFVGDSIICDTSALSFYSIVGANANYEYSWVALGGDLSVQTNPYEMAIDWHNALELKLIAVNQQNGCKDSMALPIVNKFFIENIIDDSVSNFCKHSLPFPIHGSKPYLGNLIFNYHWKVGTDSLNMSFISGADSIHLQPDTLLDTILYYQRVISLPGCDSLFSNIIKRTPEYFEILNNTISTSEYPELMGCAFSIDGSTPSADSSAAVNYYWYYSSDDTNWTLIPPNILAQKDLEYSLENIETFKIYRRVYANSCFTNSDTLDIIPQVRITTQPRDYYTCNNRLYFKVKVDNPNNLDLDYNWLFSDTINGSSVGVLSLPWQAVDSLDYVLSPSDTFFGNYYVCQVSTANCGIYSDWARYTRNPSPLVSFIEQPIVQQSPIHELESALVIVQDSALMVGHEAFQKTYVWQRSYDNIDFSDITGNNNDTLIDPDISVCNPTVYYRVKIQGAEDCPSEVSASDTLTVSESLADLMMRDYYNDSGIEINTTTDWPQIYETPDLWLRWTNDDDTLNEGANYPGPIYVYYRIKNIGSDTSKTADLYMHWTLGGPNGQNWPVAWTYNSSNTFTNRDANSAYNGLTYPTGGPINEVSISVPPLAPMETRVAYFVWDSVPNPYWYSNFVGNAATYPDTLALCLLARIHTCEQDSFGLYRKEVTWTRRNIENNNNIVGRNTKVTNVAQVMQLKKNPIFIRRFEDEYPFLGIQIKEVNNCGFSSYAKMYVTLDDPLKNAWVNGGKSGHDFLKITDNQYEVTNVSNFVMDNINLDTDSSSFITLEYQMFNPPILPVACRFEVSQFDMLDSTNQVGGFVNTVNLYPVIFSIPEKREKQNNEEIESNNDSEFKNAEDFGRNENLDSNQFTASDSIQTIIIDGMKAKIFPNPSTGLVILELQLEKESEISIELHSSIGTKVKDLGRKTYSSGKHQIELDNFTLPPGMYECILLRENDILTLKFIINR